MSRRARNVAVTIFVLGAVLSLTAGISLLALSSNSNSPEERLPMQSDGSAEGEIGDLHAAGVTGENVTVGVLDVTSYDLDHDVYSQQVATARQFGADATPVDAGDAHGTAAAATVATVAPDADLYLATFDDTDDYESALEWMVEEDVDVVVAPVAQAGTLGDGNAQLSRVTTDAVDDGLVVVAPTGNIAQGHWLGEYQPTGNGIHRFSGQTLNRLDGNASRGEFWLAWESPGENYTLELHQLQGDGTDLIARSVRYRDDGVPSERLTARLESDEEYALAVRGPTEPTGTTLRVATPTHVLSHRQQKQSLTAPGAAPGAISVGAVDPVTGDVETFSSRGPSRDGRIGVDVVAPSSQPVSGVDEAFVGTSASAAFAGGVTALMLDVDPELGPRAVRLQLSGTANSAGTAASPTTGHGTVAPLAAVSASADAAPSNQTAA